MTVPDTGVALCLQTPNHQLYSWYCDEAVDNDYIDLMNESIECRSVKIAPSAIRLQEHIRRKASHIGSEYKRKNWREYLMKYTTFDARHDEIVDVEQLENEIATLNGIVEEYRYNAQYYIKTYK